MGDTKNLKIEAPWYAYHKKVKVLFGGDPDIEVGDIYTNPEGHAFNYAFDICVRKHEKFKALEKVMPEEVGFGNVTLGIFLMDMENLFDAEHPVGLYAAIFDGNPLIKDIKEVTDFTGTLHGFVRFKPEVVQFFHDDISDYNGLWSGLAQDIAKEVFIGNAFVHFCTADLREENGGVATPLGEWP